MKRVVFYCSVGVGAVLTPTDGSCYVSSPSDVMSSTSTRSDVMSSLLTGDSGCGSPQTPWIIRVQPGQQINFTLIDFTAPPSINASVQHSSRCTPACSVTTNVLSTVVGRSGLLTRSFVGQHADDCVSLAKHDFLLVFYSDLRFRRNCCPDVKINKCPALPGWGRPYSIHSFIHSFIQCRYAPLFIVIPSGIGLAASWTPV